MVLKPSTSVVREQAHESNTHGSPLAIETQKNLETSLITTHPFVGIMKEIQHKYDTILTDEIEKPTTYHPDDILHEFFSR